MEIRTLDELFNLISKEILMDLVNPQYWEFLNKDQLPTIKTNALDNIIEYYQIEFNDDLKNKIANEALDHHLVKVIICKQHLDNQDPIIDQLAKIMQIWFNKHQEKTLQLKQKINLFVNNANAIVLNVNKINTFDLSLLEGQKLWDENERKLINLKRNYKMIENLISEVNAPIVSQFEEVINNSLYLIKKTIWYRNFGKQKRIITNIDDYLKLYEKHISNENFWDGVYAYPEWFSDNVKGIIHGWHNTFKDSTLLKNDYQFTPELANQLQQWINGKRVQLVTKFANIDMIDDFNLNQQTFLTLMLSHYESSNEIIDMVELYQDLDEDIGYIEHNVCNCEYDDGNISDFCSWCEDFCEEYNLIKEDTIWEQLKNRRDLLYEQLKKLYNQQSTSIKALLNEALNEIKVQKVNQEIKTDRHWSK